MSDAYSAMTGQPDILAGVDIVGDPAQMVEDDAGSAVKYKQAGYTAADEIHMGIGGVATIPAASAGNILQAQVSCPFKPTRVSIRSTVAPDIMVEQVRIGPTTLIEGDPIAGEIWSEVSLNQAVRWPTAETSQLIIFTLTNLNAVDAVRPGITIKGWRLRK